MTEEVGHKNIADVLSELKTNTVYQVGEKSFMAVTSVKEGSVDFKVYVDNSENPQNILFDRLDNILTERNSYTIAVNTMSDDAKAVKGTIEAAFNNAKIFKEADERVKLALGVKGEALLVDKGIIEKLISTSVKVEPVASSPESVQEQLNEVVRGKIAFENNQKLTIMLGAVASVLTLFGLGSLIKGESTKTPEKPKTWQEKVGDALPAVAFGTVAAVAGWKLSTMRSGSGNQK